MEQHPRVGGSYRDPHGFVFQRGSRYLRQISRIHRVHHEHLMSSGLYDELTGRGLLLRHRDVDVPAPEPDTAYAVIEPEQLAFVSYPYEWCHSALRDAALATLEIQSTAMRFGMSLRDASAFNIQFHHGRPVLIDTTSFEIRTSGAPWVGYRQFCDHFLGPLALSGYRDPRLRSLYGPDGIALDLVADLLPGRARMRPGLLVHLVLHARSQRRHAAGGSGSVRSLSDRAFEAVLSSLRSAVQHIPDVGGRSTWSDYYDEADHYTDDAAMEKLRLVESWIDRVAPRSVWDLGANTARFAELASRRGIPTIAFDLDPLAVEHAYRAARRREDHSLLPLVLDLTSPSPAIGWANRERASFVERGPVDLSLALALVHHLAIGANVPLAMIVDLLADVSSSAIVEWVPKEDPKVVQLLHSREDVFPDYSPKSFEVAASRRFTIVERAPLPSSGRSVYLLRPR